MNTKGYTEAIEADIEGMPPGTVFVTSDFAGIANAQYVRRVLKRMADDGTIERVLPGVFYRPKTNRLLGEPVPSDPDDVAHAIARSQNWTIAPSGQTALNLLGLSTQVPATWTYTSDGSYRNYALDGYEISFKRSANRNVKGMSPTTLLVVQALRALGESRADDDALAAISRRLSPAERKTLVLETARSTAWIQEAARKIEMIRDQS